MDTSHFKFKPIDKPRFVNGWWHFCAKPEIPDKSAIEKARSNANKLIDDLKEKNKLFSGSVRCACCDKNTGVATDISCIAESGLCNWCRYMYIAGKANYVEVSEPPILKEVLERASKGNGLTPIETAILLNEFNSLKNKLNDSSGFVKMKIE